MTKKMRRAQLKWNRKKKDHWKQSRTQRGRRYTLFLTDKLRYTSGNFAASSIT